MKKLTGLIFIILLALGTGVFLFLKNNPKSPTCVNKSENTSVIHTEEKTDDLPPSPQNYVVKSYKEHVSVFEENNSTPLKITNVLVSDLPQADQEMLKKGIKVCGQQELNLLIEDYCS